MVRQLLLAGLSLLQAAAVGALIVPAGLPEGLYHIPFDSDGTALSAPLRVESRSTQGRFEARQFQRWEARCGVLGQIQINDFTVAKENLQSECDRGETYQPNRAVIYSTGRAIAYFCNYDRQNRCTRAEYEEAMLALVGQCGIGAGGEVYLAAQDKGYGGDNKGESVEICY